MFYFEERNILGKWSPRTTPEKPDAKRAEGRNRTFRCVKEIPAELEHLTLDQLENVMGTDGHLNATGGKGGGNG